MILKHRFNSFRDRRWPCPLGVTLGLKTPSGAEARALLSNAHVYRRSARSSRCYVVTPLTKYA